MTALMFTLISLGIIMALLQMVLMGTKMSASQKTYRNSLEASYGGVELVAKEIIPQLFGNYSNGSRALNSTFGSSSQISLSLSASLKDKLAKDTNNWPSTANKIPDAKISPDMTFKLAGTNGNFMVYNKVVDTVTGNSDVSGRDLDPGIGVAGSGSGIAPKHSPHLITIEVQGERETNPKEKAMLSVLYAY
ncbi:type IV pilus minor pilin PilX [Geobacter sp. AOG1]|nr:type IV pilus minor pilin PilX [Geobacter sp. AOG1]